MAALEILEFPDSRLRTRARPVDVVDAHVTRLAENMLDTMYAARGIGLAGPQVNTSSEIIVVDVSEDRSRPLVLVNPRLSAPQGEVTSDEGCLSIPGFYEPVVRAERIHVNALDRHGQPFELDAEGLLAVCIQHECDHLEGKLFVDYISNLKRQRIRRKLAKRERQPA